MGNRVTVVVAVGFLLATVPTQGSAKEPLRLAASSAWAVDYADERCSLARDFGEGDQTVHLRIDSFGSWRDYRFLVAGKAVPRIRRTLTEFGFALTPDGKERETGSLNGTIDGLSAVSFSGSFTPYQEPPSRGTPPRQLMELAAEPALPDPSFESQVNSIRMEFDGGKTIELTLGSMGKPLEAMRACVDDLQKTWGLDPAAQKALSRKAVVKVDGVRAVQRNDPRAVPEMGQTPATAFVPIRVMVDGQGEATACVVQSGSAPADFQKAACAGLEAGGFEPALDAAGRPIPSIYHTSVIYM